MDQLSIDFNAPDMTADERMIMDLIRPGRKSAVSVKELEAHTGLNDVQVRQVVKHLVEDHGVLIVSATGNPSGYYYPASQVECDAGARQLEHRIISLAKRLRAIKKESYERFFGQRRLPEL